MKIRAIRHVRGYDVARPISIGVMLGIMLPLVLLPLLSIFIYGTSKGLGTFWSSLVAPEAIFALKLSMVTSFWATVFNVIFGLFAAYVLSRYDFWGRNAVIVTISLPTAIPTAVAGFASLLLWGPNATLGRLLNSQGVQLMFTPYAIILANIFVTFPLAFGVIKPVFDTMSRSMEEASATIGATRLQTFWCRETWPSARRRRRSISLPSSMKDRSKPPTPSQLCWRCCLLLFLACSFSRATGWNGNHRKHDSKNGIGSRQRSTTRVMGSGSRTANGSCRQCAEHQQALQKVAR